MHRSGPRAELALGDVPSVKLVVRATRLIVRPPTATGPVVVSTCWHSHAAIIGRASEAVGGMLLTSGSGAELAADGARARRRPRTSRGRPPPAGSTPSRGRRRPRGGTGRPRGAVGTRTAARRGSRRRCRRRPCWRCGPRSRPARSVLRASTTSRKPGREPFELRFDAVGHVDGRTVRHMAVRPERVAAGRRARRVEDDSAARRARTGRSGWSPRATAASAATTSSARPPRCTVPARLQSAAFHGTGSDSA